MPTRTHIDPFAPGHPPSRAELEGYLRGELDADQAHAVERWLENDPLTREALEGLVMPGALDAMSSMKAPVAGRSGQWWKAGGVMVTVAIVGALLWTVLGKGTEDAPEEAQVQPPTPIEEPFTAIPPDTGTAAAELTLRIEQARDVPESLQVGHTGTDLHNAEIAEVELDRTHDMLIPVSTLPPPAPDQALPEKKVLAPSKENRQLLFLHNLKLVSPKELYRVDPLMDLEIGGVDARYADADAQRTEQPPQRTMKYTAYMDIALGHFAKGRHKQCLQELRVVLRQYPDDVNALFYGGLSCYNLAMYEDAERYLARAWHHPISTFHEEAQWYHARSVLAGQGLASALPLLRAVADAGGFYAERAALELRK